MTETNMEFIIIDVALNWLYRMMRARQAMSLRSITL